MSNLFYSEEIQTLLEDRMTNSSVFSQLPEKIKKRLLKGKKALTFSGGSILRVEDGGIGLWSIKKGFARVGRFARDGEFYPIVISSAGGSFGDLSCFSPDYPPVDGIAIGEVEAYWISCKEFREAIAEFPESHFLIMNILATTLLLSYDVILSHRLQTSSEKLRWNLKLFCTKKQPPIPLPLSQNELAIMVGVSRMTISKELKILEEDGILERQYGEMRIMKPEAL